MKYEIQQLINRNYESTCKRGKITRETSHKDFCDKIDEELTELNHELHLSTDYYERVKDYPLLRNNADLEVTDIILTCLNYLVHSGYDPIKLMKEKISYNETRTD